MLNLIYDEDRTVSAQDVFNKQKWLNAFCRLHAKQHTKEERDALIKIALTLEEYAYALDNSKENCDNVGNLYKPHFNEESTEFQEGYNAAIRDAMDTLFGKERYNG